MTKRIISILICLCLIGCSTLKYELVAQGTVKNVEYTHEKEGYDTTTIYFEERESYRFCSKKDIPNGYIKIYKAIDTWGNSYYKIY